MKIFKFFITAVLVACMAPLHAQNADEIISTYLENTGGAEAWKGLEATKMTASVNQGGMEIPVTIYNTNDGKQAVIIEFQGQKITQLAYDGETMWTTNFMTMKPEKSEAEMTANMKLNNNDFPSPLVNYKENGYDVEYVGTETKDGTETYKVKVEQEPVMVNGTETPSISYYYFETENYVPIIVETTGQNGQMVSQSLSDYQEVEGLYFPFAMTFANQPVEIKEVILNPEIDESIFEFPEGGE